MRTGSIFTLALLLATIFLAPACDSGAKTVKTLRRAVDDVATLTARGESSGDADNVAKPLPAEVREVLVTLNELPVAERGSGIDYDRDDWRHWVDADRDCQNTRAEVLIMESVSPLVFATDEQCRVTRGRWRGPWSGEVFTDTDDVDIDHHVPLGHAHVSGGWQWSADRKRAYANDLSHPASLQATQASVNRSKGKKPPDQWRPEERAGWCAYAADWVAVKKRWELTVTAAEVNALEEMLNTCDEEGSWGLVVQASW